MDEIADSIKEKNSILLSRNKSVALVVGAASFLGSHLVDKLLEKGIQVVGVDNLEFGKKENLQKATEDKNFHLIIESAENLELDLPRLDYLFVISEGKWNMEKVLQIFKKNKCRCLLVSSIELYDKEIETEDLKWLKGAESRLAKFASDFNLNARILRLGSVYGPRMNFGSRDPMIRLIQQSLLGDLQKDPLEFSSRALFIDDAVDLIVRTIFSGATSQKIFDGVQLSPIKVTEVKQILLDPIWHENNGFVPSPLPPWTTPNLEKTIKFLNWHPSTKVVTALRQTLAYFKDNEIEVPKLEDGGWKSEDGNGEDGWDKGKKEELEAFKQKIEESKAKTKRKKGIEWPKFSLPLSKIYLLLVVALVTYALIWPSLVFGWGIFTFYNSLGEGLKNLEKGEFEKSLQDIKRARAGAEAAKSIVDGWEPVKKTGFLKKEFEVGESLINLSSLSIESAQSSIVGIQALLQAVKAVTGELDETPFEYFNSAQVELDLASKSLSKANALINNQSFSKNLPSALAQKLSKYPEKLTLYENLLKKVQALSILLPNMVANKDYLILLQNNMELRPGGGFIGSFAKVSFEGGKLKKLEVNDIYAIDGQLSIHVEPPKEIKEDLGQNSWYLRDSNWESDFPTSARQAEWFYTKETGERVDGVVALDVSAIEELLDIIGPLELKDYNEKITSKNLFEQAITHAELSFFPGSQAKKSFMTALTNEAFNKIFFLPQKNWPGIISAMGRSLDKKHVSIYLNDPKLFSYITAQNWAHALPRVSEETKNSDFLSIVEANLGANKVNYYLDRSYKLETIIGKDGQVTHRMRISYTNRSPSDVFPGGKYKNRMRVYLPFGSKVSRVLWGESDITKNLSSFVDYGRSSYSMLLELAPKEQKTLVIDYTIPWKLEFENGKASYRLDIIKQAGTLKDPLEWTITYPISYQLTSDQTKKIGPQEQTILTDLSIDRSFEVEFTK